MENKTIIKYQTAEYQAATQSYERNDPGCNSKRENGQQAENVG